VPPRPNSKASSSVVIPKITISISIQKVPCLQEDFDFHYI